MDINVQQIIDYIMPKIKDDKKQEAKSMIEQATSQSGSNPLSGLSFGSFDLSNVNLAGLMPQLTSMIKPEYVQQVKDYLGKYMSNKQTV